MYCSCDQKIHEILLLSTHIGFGLDVSCLTIVTILNDAKITCFFFQKTVEPIKYGNSINILFRVAKRKNWYRKEHIWGNQVKMQQFSFNQSLESVIFSWVFFSHFFTSIKMPINYFLHPSLISYKCFHSRPNTKWQDVDPLRWSTMKHSTILCVKD